MLNYISTRAVKSGEAAEKNDFTRVFDEFAPKIYRFVYLRTGAKEIAEDIASQTFLKTWEYSRQGNKVRSYPVFLYRVARNLIADHWRDKNNVLKRLDEETAVKLVDYKNIPEKIMAESDLKLVIYALENLPPDQKDIIYFKFIDGLSAKEIAALTGKNPGAVYVSIFRSLKLLKKRLLLEDNPKKYV